MTYQLKNPPTNLYDAVRAGFAAQNNTLNKWCKANGVNHEAARQTLLGARRGDEADQLCQRIMKDAGVIVTKKEKTE
jgi:hypothetical protein